MSRKNRDRHRAVVVAPPPVGIMHPAGAATISEALDMLNSGNPPETPRHVVAMLDGIDASVAERQAEGPAPGDPPSAFGAIDLSAADPAFVAELRKRARCLRRIVHRDSLHWTCACGATGNVSRSKDGIPNTDEDIPAHAPGDTRS